MNFLIGIDIMMLLHNGRLHKSSRGPGYDCFICSYVFIKQLMLKCSMGFWLGLSYDLIPCHNVSFASWQRFSYYFMHFRKESDVNFIKVGLAVIST